MKRWLPIAVLCAAFLLSVAGIDVAFAQRTLEVNTGPALSLEQLVMNIVNFLASAIVYLCVALFMIGAFFLVISQGEGGNFDKGKGLIIGSIVGLAVTLGAAAIIRTLYYFFYSA